MIHRSYVFVNRKTKISEIFFVGIFARQAVRSSGKFRVMGEKFRADTEKA